MSTTQGPPEWYRDWFGEEYLALYPHRDEEEARAAVELVCRGCAPPEGPILDLACGAGRHMLEFERRGLNAIGLDLSAPLLQQARARSRDLLLVRGDMRHLPFADGSFQFVANFFTSFGYFADSHEDVRVLGEIRRVLSQGGCFALDFLNAQRVRSGLVDSDERFHDGRRVVQQRRLEEGGKVVVKEIRIFEANGDRLLGDYYERVRLYEPQELEEMLRAAGLRPARSYGDYTGSPPGPQAPRFILLGHAV
ncbi:MAG: class I SAM-dependent methyltransferase [Gemmatimonadota bacterium]|nr:MAG: class I SAM-dependent methyltransferase [Gemmatimonadota bacterium]